MSKTTSRNGYSLKWRLKLLVQEIMAYSAFLLLPTNRSAKKVVIFGQGRSGSTLLESLLSSTGHFNSSGESLGNVNSLVLFPYAFISGLAKLKMNQNFLFHLKVYHLTRDRKTKVDAKKFMQKLDKSGWEIIFLIRENRVKQALSNILARERGHTQKFDDAKEVFQVKLDLSEMDEKISNRFRHQDEEIRALKGLPFCKVVYEQDLEDSKNHQKTVDRILDFLELESRPVKTKHRKINVNDPRDIIVNYEEFWEFLKGKGLEKDLN